MSLEDDAGALETIEKLLTAFPENQQFQEMRSPAEQNLSPSSASKTSAPAAQDE